jgi:hypothetical protein
MRMSRQSTNDCFPVVVVVFVVLVVTVEDVFVDIVVVWPVSVSPPVTGVVIGLTATSVQLARAISRENVVIMDIRKPFWWVVGCPLV